MIFKSQGVPSQIIPEASPREIPASQSLSRNESLRLLALSQGFCDLYFRLDAEGIILDHSVPDSSIPSSGIANSQSLNVAEIVFSGRRIQDILPGDAAESFHQALQEIRREPRIITIQCSLKIADSQQHFEVQLIPLPDNQVAVVARNITAHKNTETTLRETESKFRGIFENAVEGIFQTTSEGKYISANPALATLYGYASPEELMDGITNIQRQLYVDTGRRKEFARLMKKTGVVSNFESPIQRRDGSVIWISENAREIRDDAGVLLGYEGTVVDITERVIAEHERVKAETALRISETKLREVVEHSSNLFYSHTPDHVLTYLSPQTRTFLDCEPEEGRISWTAFCTDNPINAEGMAICQFAIETGEPQPPYELELRGRKGRVIRVEVNEAPVVQIVNGRPKTTAMVGALVDITRRKTVEDQLKHQAFHDSLTGLPNRVLFLDRLEHALARTRRLRHEGISGPALLFLDLDRFKTINDSLGHEYGDRLLEEVAVRLQSCLRPGDTAARLGGDEFTVLLEETSDLAEALGIAERIAHQLQKPLHLGSQNIRVTASMGLVLSRSPEDVAENLLRDADIAMYRAKSKNRGTCEVFDQQMSDHAEDQLNLENDLRQALEREEMRLLFQPHYDLASRKIIGFEALLRWEHAHRNTIMPDNFISLAEDSGLIVPIGKWVLQQACAQAKLWQQEYSEPIEISVNLSARQMRQPELASQVAAVLEETQLPPHLLKLEITESVMMEDAEQSLLTLHALSTLGVRLAIDDFGTGYSSLSYLRRFPINCLKVDRTFVQNLGENAQDTEIVRAIVTLAKTLGLQVVAEGVEKESHIDLLRELGCDIGQGFYFTKPLTKEDAAKLLSAN